MMAIWKGNNQPYLGDENKVTTVLIFHHFQATKFSWNPHVSEGFPPKKILTNESPRDDWKWFRTFYVGFAGPGCLENVPQNIFAQMVSLIVMNSIGSQSHTWDTSWFLWSYRLSLLSFCFYHPRSTQTSCELKLPLTTESSQRVRRRVCRFVGTCLWGAVRTVEAKTLFFLEMRRGEFTHSLGIY